MSSLIIKGGKKLKGNITLSGNKNSALKIIAAAISLDSPTTLHNVPLIKDVDVMISLITSLGVKCTWESKNTLIIDPSKLTTYKMDSALSERIRASVVLAAPLLARFGKAVLTPPGGDQIGERVLNTHFSMMQNLGVDIHKENKHYLLEWKRKPQKSIFLEEASVTATEMGLILASCRNNTVTISDAAAEPSIQELADFLKSSGAKISGAGTNTIHISGKKKRKGVEHTIWPDYIEGGTFAILSAITGSNLTINNVIPSHYDMTKIYLKALGVDIQIRNNSLIINPSKLIAQKKSFQTRPWPGFPTDLMSPLIVLATQSQGTVLCHDWMYEWRIFFVDDLISMGANIFIADPHRVVVTGPNKLHGENLICKDIRAGISILLAALVADGQSTIEGSEMIDRGYENIVEKLKRIGANIS